MSSLGNRLEIHHFFSAMDSSRINPEDQSSSSSSGEESIRTLYADVVKGHSPLTNDYWRNLVHYYVFMSKSPAPIKIMFVLFKGMSRLHVTFFVRGLGNSSKAN